MVWLDTAVRADVEPRRDVVEVVGFGPYRTLVPVAA